MVGSTEDFRPQHVLDGPLLVFIVCLVVCVAVLIGVGIHLYRSDIQTVTVGENRFLTVEWHLLQKLKAQTDRELGEKDREIAELEQRYRFLKSQDASAAVLSQIESRLRQIESQRESILAERIGVSSGKQGERAAPPVSPGDARTGENGNTTAELLAQRIRTLEDRLDQSERRVSRAEAELALSRMSTSTPAPSPVADTAPVAATVPAPSGGVQRDDILRTLEEKERALGDESPASLEDLRTRSLLRALVRSAEIRAAYPNLVDSLDHYLAAYGRQEELKGQRAAYAAAIESVRPTTEK